VILLTTTELTIHLEIVRLVHFMLCFFASIKKKKQNINSYCINEADSKQFSGKSRAPLLYGVNEVNVGGKPPTRK
jgi:hypothetical protein